jgi:hypothetical protein
VGGDCVSLWKGLPDGFAHLLICHTGDSLKITFDSLYDGEFARYTVVREFRDYAHTWDELLMRARVDPNSLWGQALKDITEDFFYRKKMESVLKVAQAVLNGQ